MTKPFTQKHFGTKGASTDDSHNMTKQGATLMKKCPVMSYGGPIQQRKEGETREQYGKRTYQEAMSKIEAQKKSAAERKKQKAREQRSTINVSMGLGTSRTSGQIKLPRVSTGMGTSRTTHKFNM